MIDYYKLEEKYDDVSNFVCGFAVVTICNKCGIINTSAKEICEIKYDWIVNINGLFFKVLFNNKWGIINNKGEEICECKYDNIFDYVEIPKYFAVRLKDKYGWINEQGIEIIPCADLEEILEKYKLNQIRISKIKSFI